MKLDDFVINDHPFLEVYLFQRLYFSYFVCYGLLIETVKLALNLLNIDRNLLKMLCDTCHIYLKSLDV